MKKLLSLSAFILALGLLTFVACKKEDSINISSAEAIDKSQFFQGVNFIEGQLIFEHEGAIQSVSKAIAKDEEQAVKTLKAQFPSFRSNREITDALLQKTDMENAGETTFEDVPFLMSIVVEKDGEKMFHKTIESPVLANICNEKGFFQLGSILYQVTRDYVNELDANSKSLKNRTKIIREESDFNQRALDTDVRLECGGSKKFRSKIYNELYAGMYTETGVWCEYTKKNWLGFWVTTDAANLNFFGTVIERRASLGDPTGLCSVDSFTISNSGNSTGKISRVANVCWFCCMRVGIDGSTNTSNLTTSNAVGGCVTTRSIFNF